MINNKYIVNKQPPIESWVNKWSMRFLQITGEQFLCWESIEDYRIEEIWNILIIESTKWCVKNALMCPF